MAAAAMRLKRKIVRPTPARVRAKVPRSALNEETGEAASNWTIYNIFKTMCYDEAEDDPWQYLPTVTKDYLPESMKPKRVAMAQHILDTTCLHAQTLWQRRHHRQRRGVQWLLQRRQRRQR